MPDGLSMSAKAVIVDRGRLLVVRKRKGRDGATCASLPGGHVEAGETLLEALQRECREELGTPVAVDGLIGILDQGGGEESKIQALFRCRLESPENLGFGSSPDHDQEDVHWQAVDALDDLEPAALCDFVRSDAEGTYRNGRG
jgi:8-oxo-dGTP diphosphatase